ncbi:MAG: glycoside hydrolase family 3 C-terminal domain-containing protein [Sedimentisphaerales bacterium]|nr:glycoside hydrolase family 3 C-terminal domain-containing protein [Sedimentisphaerales bacterium]
MNPLKLLTFKCVCICIIIIINSNANVSQLERRLTENGYEFRDLNKNGKLDPYEDSRLDIDKRIADLLGQMTLEEKVGLMFSPIIGLHPDGSLVEDQSFYSQIGSTEAIVKKHINHIGNFIQQPPEIIAAWNNNIQKLAEKNRLGIPVTIYSDPRHGINKPYTINNAYFPGISHWPDALGLAATRDMELIRQFGSIVAREYRTVGITVALHPMADLATEPRWGRIGGTFGDDANLAAKCVTAYIKGHQGETWEPESVVCMTKHFPGGGPQKDGWDCHFTYGKEQVYPGNNFDYHLIPFKAAIEAGTAQIMPYYAVPIGQLKETTGFGYSKEIVAELLREKLGFSGVICSDGGVISPYLSQGRELSYAKCWGEEDLTVKDRFKKAIEAGLDQFLVECTPEIVVELVNEGAIGRERIDQSAERILRDKFRLGLFDNPFVDIEKAEEICGSSEFQAVADLAQRKSLVLLKNQARTGAKILPLSKDKKVFLLDIDPVIASEYAEVVNNINEADIVIARLNTPYQRRQGPHESMIHQGDLDFKGRDLNRIVELMKAKPTIVCIYIERAAVIPEIAEHAAALLATFGSSDAAVLDVLFGKFRPTGKLPIELPRSMEAVKNQKEDVPCDSQNPLFEFGYGLTY